MLSAPDFKQKQIAFAQLSRGDKLSFKNDNLIIKDKNNKIKHQSTCYRLFALFIVGHITVTSGLLQRAKKFGFSIHFLSHNLRHYGAWQSAVEGNTLLRQKQYSYDKLDIAQHLVANKIQQQIITLNKRRKKSAELKKSITQLKNYHSRLPNSNHQLQDILGIEGIASRVYFSQLYKDHNWQGRKPRAKNDITNVLLDIGYTLLFNLIDDMLQLYGFDVYQGVYHQLFYQRKSLVCDLVEPFRPIIDHRILTAWNLNQIKGQDFDFHQHQYRLDWQKSKPYVKFLLTALLEEKEAIFIYIQQYYRAFMRDKPIEQFPIYKPC